MQQIRKRCGRQRHKAPADNIIMGHDGRDAKRKAYQPQTPDNQPPETVYGPKKVGTASSSHCRALLALHFDLPDIAL